MNFNRIKLISENELLKKVEEGVYKTAVWQKPLLLLTKNGSDYIYNNIIRETYRDSCIVNEPFIMNLLGLMVDLKCRLMA